MLSIFLYLLLWGDFPGTKLIRKNFSWILVKNLVPLEKKRNIITTIVVKLTKIFKKFKHRKRQTDYLLFIVLIVSLQINNAQNNYYLRFYQKYYYDDLIVHIIILYPFPSTSINK